MKTILNFRLCGRLNISSDNSNLSLFIHMMRGDYDDTLSWPFSGHIILSLIHPTDPAKNFVLPMPSSPDSDAFRRCSTGNINNEIFNLNPRAFGFVDFFAIDEVFEKGFIKNDTIVIKITVKCT